MMATAALSLNTYTNEISVLWELNGYLYTYVQMEGRKNDRGHKEFATANSVSFLWYMRRGPQDNVIF